MRTATTATRFLFFLSLLTTLCQRALVQGHPDYPLTYFINPPDAGPAQEYATNTVYQIGSILNVTWATNETFTGIFLEQQSLDDPGLLYWANTAVLEPSYTDSRPIFFLWKVSTLDLDLNMSNVFLLSIGTSQDFNTAYANTHYFNLTLKDVGSSSSASSSSASSSSASSSSTSSSSATSSSASLSSASSSSASSSSAGTSTATKIGLGVGLGVGILLLLILLGFLVLAVRKRRAGRQSKTASSNFDMKYTRDQQMAPYQAKELPATALHELQGNDDSGPHELTDHREPAEL